ncbi:MAG: ribulose-phosphate 3-epimerase, partial [Flammeovirgaceae bacterium]|nr:ribulose-phosphate 3-epimerase [Flammeovirgaceae bacterium]
KRTFYKVHRLKELILVEKSNALIEVDGGVDETIAEELLKFGADVLVAGSYVFDHPSPLLAIQHLKALRRF